MIGRRGTPNLARFNCVVVQVKDRPRGWQAVLGQSQKQATQTLAPRLPMPRRPSSKKQGVIAVLRI